MKLIKTIIITIFFFKKTRGKKGSIQSRGENKLVSYQALEKVTVHVIAYKVKEIKQILKIGFFKKN
jgi:hypothetical protein